MQVLDPAKKSQFLLRAKRGSLYPKNNHVSIICHTLSMMSHSGLGINAPGIVFKSAKSIKSAKTFLSILWKKKAHSVMKKKTLLVLLAYLGNYP